MRRYPYRNEWGQTPSPTSFCRIFATFLRYNGLDCLEGLGGLEGLGDVEGLGGLGGLGSLGGLEGLGGLD